MKSYGTVFDDLFNAYENMRDRSEITAEIEVIEPMVDEDADWESLEDLIDHFYHKGYRDALRWVVKGECMMPNKYNEAEVQKAIDKDKSIGKKEAKLIHALLKGWKK